MRPNLAGSLRLIIVCFRIIPDRLSCSILHMSKRLAELINSSMLSAYASFRIIYRPSQSIAQFAAFYAGSLYAGFPRLFRVLVLSLHTALLKIFLQCLSSLSLPFQVLEISESHTLFSSCDVTFSAWGQPCSINLCWVDCVSDLIFQCGKRRKHDHC
jgi:hypothetical protein